jgi:hypothetical protein
MSPDFKSSVDESYRRDAEDRTTYVDPETDDRLDSENQFKVTGTAPSGKVVDILTVNFKFDESITVPEQAEVIDAVSKAAYVALSRVMDRG